MATSSFDKKFIIKDPKALKNLEKALENAEEKYIPKRDIDKEIDKGVKKLNQSLLRSI